MTEVVLENFDTSLDGAKVVFFVAATGALQAQLNDLIRSPAISSRVLIASASSPSREQASWANAHTASSPSREQASWANAHTEKSEISLLFKGTWNAVFQPASSPDWQLVLTYCAYMAKPAIIVIEDGVVVPDAFIARLQPQKNLQIVCLRVLGAAGQVPSWADAVFLPHVADLASADADAVLNHLGGLCGNTVSAEHRKALLREVRVAKAALVWTRIQERGPTGAVYWYDPSDSRVECPALPMRAIRKYMNALIDNIPHA